MMIGSHERPPIIKSDTPESRVIVAHWHKARDARNFHVSRAGTRGNIEAMMAGHKMDWLKDILRDVEASK